MEALARQKLKGTVSQYGFGHLVSLRLLNFLGSRMMYNAKSVFLPVNASLC
jgi:hypothetical protein